MAEGKKGFILYADIIHTVSQLSDVKAGKLFKHILRYVNDENPKCTDQIINLVFTPIQQQLKRDLKHWESIREKRSEAGKMGGRPKKQIKANKPNASFDKQTKAKKAVIVNVNDTVNVKENVIVNVTVKEITKRWFDFYEKRTNIKPSFDGAQGNALKLIIKHIEKQQNPGQKTEDTFQFILDRWNVLDEWLQSSCLDLKILNSKINVVLDQIKNNGKGNKKGFAERVGQYYESTDPNFKNL